jgi:hypothetical protein
MIDDLLGATIFNRKPECIAVRTGSQKHIFGSAVTQIKNTLPDSTTVPINPGSKSEIGTGT